MATLIEYFRNDFPDLSIDSVITVTFQKLNTLTNEKVDCKVDVIVRMQHDMFSSARMFTFYIPDNPDTVYVIGFIIGNLDTYKNHFNGIEAIGGFTGDVTVGIHQLIYTNRIYLYVESILSNEDVQELDAFAKSISLHITLRSQDYLKKKLELEKPFAFISHDSRDKNLIAGPLADGLNSRLCYTWYDEYSLKIGDSLRESIEKGIKEAKKCILILTPHFISNTGWTKKEFNSIFTREMIKNERIVFPIWYNVTKNEVYEYSPSLADTVALVWPSPENKTEKQYDQERERLISKIHTELSKP